MIAVCPSCHARYRIEDQRVGPGGARLRCARCRGLFRVPPPGTAPGIPEPGSGAPEPVWRPQAKRPVESADAGLLLADADRLRAQQTAKTLKGMGLAVQTVHDGVEALMDLLTTPKPVVILWADLPRISGWDLAEIIQRSEALRATGVMVVGAALAPGQTMPRRDGVNSPALHVDRLDSGGPLESFLERFGVWKPPAERELELETPGNGTEAVSSSTSFGSVSAAPGTVSDLKPGLHEEREKAERLARIVVSDMVLYHPERFERASDDSSLLDEFSAEIQEGLTLMGKRVDQKVLSERDYLVEELQRVAHEQRGG